MAQTAIVAVTESWANVLSTGTTTSVAFQVRDGTVEVIATASGTPPAATVNGLVYKPEQGELVGALTRFGTGTPTHLYMRAIPLTGAAGNTAKVFVTDDAA